MVGDEQVTSIGTMITELICLENAIYIKYLKETKPVINHPYCII